MTDILLNRLYISLSFCGRLDGLLYKQARTKLSIPFRCKFKIKCSLNVDVRLSSVISRRSIVYTASTTVSVGKIGINIISFKLQMLFGCWFEGMFHFGLSDHDYVHMLFFHKQL